MTSRAESDRATPEGVPHPIRTAIRAASEVERRLLLDLLDTCREAVARAVSDAAVEIAERDAEIEKLRSQLRGAAVSASGLMTGAEQVLMTTTEHLRAAIARLRARVAELEARPVLTVEWLAEALSAGLLRQVDPGETVVSATFAKLSPFAAGAQFPHPNQD